MSDPWSPRGITYIWLGMLPIWFAIFAASGDWAVLLGAAVALPATLAFSLLSP